MAQDYTVPEGVRRERADKVLAQAFPEHSRSALQRAFDAGLVRVGDRVLSKSDSVNEGEVLSYAMPELKTSELRPVDLPLDIIYEDEHFVAINKAAGMIVHPGAGTGEDTVVHAMLAHCEGELSGVGGVERPGIVHRIDKETTGLLLVAKTDAAHRGLSEQFAGRQLRKEYLALVSGCPQLMSGVVDRAISRHPVHRQRMTVGEGGKPARTDWERVEAFPPLASLIRCRIHTGRTHQIRVHMKSLGHILLGDEAYGWREDLRLAVQPERVMLHAEHIVFLHPVTARTMDLRAPLPKDFEKLLRSLRKTGK
jgi:23S rRNA pseudouridine1911/1915/1917 synthase